MCGRYARAKDKATLVEEFAVQDASPEDLAADYNVAPTKRVYIVADRAADEAQPAVRSLTIAKWGLVPSWAKDPKIGSRLINARVETAATKPSFRSAFAKRRCLVPADGFYEWYESADPGAPKGRSGKPVKQPFFIHAADGGTLALAGLFEFWRDRAADPEEPWLLTVTILTTTASDAVGRIHDRMPLPLPAEAWQDWLDPKSSPEAAESALQLHTAGDLVTYPVSTAVNSVRNNGAELMDPIPLEG